MVTINMFIKLSFQKVKYESLQSERERVKYESLQVVLYLFILFPFKNKVKLSGDYKHIY